MEEQIIQTQENQNQASDEEKKKIKRKRQIFWTRFAFYIAIGLFIPVGFLIWRFQLFQSASHLNFGGWGVVAVLFTSIFLMVLSKQAVSSIESQIVKQAINAIRKIFLPLFAITMCLYAVKNFIDELIQFFVIITICEPIAYVINPFPEIVKEHEKDREKNKLVKFAEIFWSQKD